MATITSLGIGSGLDLNGLLDQLQKAERGKLTPIVQQQAQQKAKISAYGQLQSALNSFQTAVETINDPKLYQSLSAKVSGATISATATADALPGSYSVEVSALATAGTLASTRVAEQDTELALQGATGIKLTAGNGDTVTVAIAPGSSLADMRDAINADENAGVNATIINDGEGYRLALSAKNTGADASINAFEFVDDLGATVVGPFTQDAATQQPGQDAAISVNGIAITSANNLIEGAIQGVTLNLDGLSIAVGETATSTVKVERNTLAVRDAVGEFVKAYNSFNATMDKLTSFNSETGDAGKLLGDSTARTVESRLRQALSTSVKDGEFGMLSQLGISIERDGTLAVDDEVISDLAANNPNALQDFFVGSDASPGFASQMGTTLEQLLGDNGRVKGAISGAETRIESLNERYERMESSIERTISRYRTQFGQLDAMIAQMNSTSSYLTQQFDALDAQLGRD